MTNSHTIVQSNFNDLQGIFQKDTLLFDNFNEYSQIQRHEPDQFTFENHVTPPILMNSEFNQAVTGSEPEFLDDDLQPTLLEIKEKRCNVISFNAISHFAPFEQSSIIGDSSPNDEKLNG
jgi:hypothetical protein